MLTREFISNKEKYLDIIKKDWEAANDSFPDFLTEIEKDTKLDNEQYIKKISADIEHQIKKYRKIPVLHKIWCRKTLDLVNNVLYNEEILGLHHYMSQAEMDTFCEELKDFLRHARKFAPELSFAGIGQAIRNYIVYAMFKKLHKINSGFNLAAYGYSMLYPFTDNYIDDNSLSSGDKAEYNKLIRGKIEGRKVHPESLHQQKTCQLLQYIEDLYPRDRESSVYLLLLMMLDAQEISIRQQSRTQPLTENERLDISIYKGSISVLMDRFLTGKDMSEADLNFYLGFGYFLQLADDLQDINEDNNLGHSTLFTVDLRCSQEEKTVNKLLHYVHTITEAYTAEDNHMKQFLLQNSYHLIFSSAIRSRKFFSLEYLYQLEKYLPVTVSFWETVLTGQIENQSIKTQNKYMNILDELIK